MLSGADCQCLRIFLNGGVELSCRRECRAKIRSRFAQFRINGQGFAVVVNCRVQIILLLRSNALAQILVRLIQGGRFARLRPGPMQSKRNQHN